VKVLPERLARSPEARQRFEREARAASSLNHPHICVLHDVGHQDGIDFLVREYLEGESLAARLERGPLPLDQVRRLGMQLADALDKAHRRGLVHRDLKPGNVMLTGSGAKLLDFGLAKIASPVAAAAPTVTSPVTAAGMVLGTFQYMSPEQIEGREADARSDISVWVVDGRSGEAKPAVKFPGRFYMLFRVCWTPDGKSVIVNRSEIVSHIVLLEDFGE
jgi:serine/threonine protein kinase